jgi:hypothetical protein
MRTALCAAAIAISILLLACCQAGPAAAPTVAPFPTVTVLPTLTPTALPTSTPKPIDYQGVVITLQRTVCLGLCPSYSLTIHGDGSVDYFGREFVKVTGEQTGQVSQDKVRELVDEFYRIDFFSLKSSYDADILDLPTTITSITIDGRTMRVEDRYDAPQALTDLEKRIDEVANSKKWVEGE